MWEKLVRSIIIRDFNGILGKFREGKEVEDFGPLRNCYSYNMMLQI